MAFPDSVKSIYYKFEDKYYDILDKIEGAGAPVYKIIDPIDQIFPSFILIIIFVFLLGFLLLIGIMGAVSGTATFIVEDENGDPLPDILVTLTGEQEEIKTTDAFGEFQTSFFGENIIVEVDENDFEKYNEEFNVQAGGTYTIRLQSEGSSLKAKTIRFQVRDENQRLLNNSVNVAMTFSCSGNATAPSSFSRTGGSQQVTTQTNCGILTATINATGYKEKSKSINVATHEGIALINLEKDELFGTIRVLVKDADTGEVVGGVSLKVKRNGVTFINGGTTDPTGSKIISRVPVGTYLIEAIPQADSGYVNSFSPAFTITANDARSNRPAEVAIFLRKVSPTKKILLKFVDQQGEDPIEDVEAQIVADNIYTLKLFSNADGMVEYINADESVNYAVIASHDDYLIKVTEDLPVIESSSNVELTIKLEKITEPEESVQNFGNARIIVTDFAGEPVPNADTRLYEAGLEFPIGTGYTGSDGITQFNNLPISDYNAHTEKTIDGIVIKS